MDSARSEIKYSDVMYFYYHLLNEKDLQANTVDTIHTVLHPTFQLAVRDEIIRKNPSDGVMAEIKRKAGRIKASDTLDLENKAELLWIYGRQSDFSHWHPFSLFCWVQGAELREVVGIEWEDLDYENRLININHSVTYYPRKGQENKEVRICSIASKDGGRYQDDSNDGRSL